MDAGVIAIVAATVGPLLGYIAATRKLSGKIETSEAESLWAESAAIRSDYRERIKELEERLDRIEGSNVELKRENDELKIRNRDLGQTCERLRKERDAARAEIEVLKRTIRSHLSD